MSNQAKIVGKYNDGKRILDCFGKIEIIKIDDKHQTAYASWQLFGEKNLRIANVTKTYCFGENNPQEKIIEMIVTDIQKYRINRQKVFSDLRIND